MIVRFWGVRGSSPTPLGPEELRGKISAVLQRVKPSDLLNSETRQRFLAKLPQDIFGTVGGNTACIEVRTAADEMIILDMGTGLRELEKRMRKHRERIRDFHIFISHFHYDHLLGLPYFGVMYNPEARVTFYSPYPAMERILARFMKKPFHPVGWDSFTAQTEFRILKLNDSLRFGDAVVSWIKRNHPNGSMSYKVSENGKSFIYSSDTELTEKDFLRTPENIEYFQGTDAIVLDAQYTLGEAIEKYNWGHSSYSLAVEFAREFNIKQLFLYHHEPLNIDSHLEGILRSAQWFDRRVDHKGHGTLDIDLAREGYVLEL